MTVKRGLKSLIRRAGFHVSRWPAGSHSYHVQRALMSAKPSILVDVGANKGQYAMQVREFGFAGDIYSMEPGSSAFDRLRKASNKDRHWEVVQIAAGQAEAEMQLHIAADGGQSSSFKQVLDTLTSVHPTSVTIATEFVQVRRLDRLAAERKWQNAVVKIDTQGFEQEVLEGCGDWLEEILGIQLELSIVQLYSGTFTWQETIECLTQRGFQLAAVEPGFADSRTGRMLQFDAVLLRT